MSTEHAHQEAGTYGDRDLAVLAAAAQTSTSALHAFYLATAAHLFTALSLTGDEAMAEDVLVSVYLRLRHCPSAELASLADGDAVMAWLTRAALIELALARRAGADQTRDDLARRRRRS